MKNKIFAVLAIVVLLFVVVMGESNATPLAGKALHAENLYQGVSQWGYDVVFSVNPTAGVVELPVWGHLSVNVEDIGPNAAILTITEVAYSGPLGPSPNLGHFAAVTPSIPRFTDVTLGAASAGWNDPSRVSFTVTSFSFDFGRLNTTPGDFVRLDITTASAPVPEPATMLLFGTGIAGLAGSRMRRKQK